MCQLFNGSKATSNVMTCGTLVAKNILGPDEGVEGLTPTGKQVDIHA